MNKSLLFPGGGRRARLPPFFIVNNEARPVRPYLFLFSPI
nr:MAG TPA: hypothetical protein [Caudoviricetes sp.]